MDYWDGCKGLTKKLKMAPNLYIVHDIGAMHFRNKGYTYVYVTKF